MDVFYDERMVAENSGFSPSPEKPREVIRYWRQYDRPINRKGFKPATRDQIRLAHSEAYVDGVLDCLIENGHGTKDAAFAESLPWVIGSHLAASEAAVSTGRNVCSPTSGFHHASYEQGVGFCTFNGLLVSAVSL